MLSNATLSFYFIFSDVTSNCTDLIKLSGCNLVEGIGCLCLEVSGCPGSIAFQYPDQDECMKDWNQLEGDDNWQ